MIFPFLSTYRRPFNFSFRIYLALMNSFGLLTWEVLYPSFNSKWQSCCVFSVVGFLLSQLYVNHATFFRSAKFLHKYQLIDLWESFLVCDSLLFSLCFYGYLCFFNFCCFNYGIAWHVSYLVHSCLESCVYHGLNICFLL